MAVSRVAIQASTAQLATGLLEADSNGLVIATTLGAKRNSGQYTGDSTANKAIAHGFPKSVAAVFITDTVSNNLFIIFRAGVIAQVPALGYAVTAWDATNFYVGNTGNYSQSANLNGVTYLWVAVGQ